MPFLAQLVIVGLEGGVECTQGLSRARRDFFAKYSKGARIALKMTQPRSVIDFAPARRSIQMERNQFGDLFQNLCQGPGPVNVFENPAATLLDLCIAPLHRRFGLNPNGD